MNGVVKMKFNKGLERRGLNLRRFIESCGGNAEVAGQRIRHYMDLPENDPLHLPSDSFSLYEVALHCLKPNVDISKLAISGKLSEAVDVTQFTQITTQLISKKVMDSYNEYPKIADELVTEFSSSLITDTIPNVFLKGDLQDVAPGGHYQHTGDEEEYYVTIGHQKRGMILDITEESVRFDQTGMVMMKAQGIGERMALDREKRVIYYIMDTTVNNVNYYCYYPSGTREAIWANADTTDNNHYYDNLITDALADYTDIKAAMDLLGLMADNNHDPIVVQPSILLVPQSLSLTAWRLINNEWLFGHSFSYQERNPYQNAFKVLSSSLIDKTGVTNATTNWWLGDFKRQFAEKVVIPMEVKSRKLADNNEDAWDRDIVASFKCRYDSIVGALDYRRVIKSSGTA